MPAGNDFNNQYQKERAQYLNLRGAQIAQNVSKQDIKLESRTEVHGSKKQLVGTVVGITVVFLILIMLKLRGIL